MDGGRWNIESRSSSWATSLAEMEGHEANENRLGNLVARTSLVQRSSQKDIVEPSPK